MKYFILFMTIIFGAISYNGAFAQPLLNKATGAENVSSQKTDQVVDSSQQIADRIVNSKIPVVVDFWASWCGPCKMLNPIIKQLEKEYEGKILFVKVNVDIHRALSSYFGVSAIPAVFIIKDKTAVKMIPGLQPKEAYTEAIDEVLSMKSVPSGKSGTK